MSRVLLLATNNDKKRKELDAMADGAFVVRTLRDMKLDDVDIIEDKETFAGNAQVKVDTILAALVERGQVDEVWAILADDSGLIVDALDGGPGVRSARFALDHDAGEGDDANNALLLKMLNGKPHEERTARYACAICVRRVGDDDVIEAFDTVEGWIAPNAKGDGGFGYDPYFIPQAHPERHMAELSPDEKHAISHRGKATRAALALLSAR